MFEELGVEHLQMIIKGGCVTIEICVIAVLVGVGSGFLVGLMGSGKYAVLRWATNLYVGVIRGIPILLLIFFSYFGVPLLLPGGDVPEFVAAIIALSLFASAYIGEIVRGSINAIPTGQVQAAEALGMRYWTYQFSVILPQAIRLMVPPGVGFLVVLIKDSSLVAVIGLMDLTRAGKITASLTARPISAYLIVGALYFVICYFVSEFGKRYERRLRNQSSVSTSKKAMPAMGFKND